jgi:hypothetical protein
MKKNVIRVALSFATFTKDQLNSFLILLLVCLKNNPLFPSLPVKYADLEALVTDFQAKLAASAVGGKIDTAAFTESRNAVIAALRQIAGYIQSLGLTNESDVLSSGFDIIVPDGIRSSRWSSRSSPWTIRCPAGWASFCRRCPTPRRIMCSIAPAPARGLTWASSPTPETSSSPAPLRARCIPPASRPSAAPSNTARGAWS